MVRSHAALRAASRELIGLVIPPDRGIRLVGVTVSNFEAVEASEALPLFEAGAADVPAPQKISR